MEYIEPFTLITDEVPLVRECVLSRVRFLLLSHPDDIPNPEIDKEINKLNNLLDRINQYEDRTHI